MPAGASAGIASAPPSNARPRSVAPPGDNFDNAALDAHDELEAHAHLPPDLRQVVPLPARPALSREAQRGLHRMLVEELARLEQDWPGRN